MITDKERRSEVDGESMCISTAYENKKTGPVLAENIESLSQQDGAVILKDIMGKETVIPGMLKSADLTNGVLIIESA